MGDIREQNVSMILSEQQSTKFLKAFLLALLLLLPLKVAFSAVFPGREIGSIRSWYEAKVERLKPMPSPRIILAGGSATYFGLDAGVLSKKLGQSVMNFGLHAGMGALTNVELAIHQARPGDLIIWSPEYDTLLDHSLQNDLSVGVRLAIGDMSVFRPQTLLSALTVPTGLTAGFGIRRHGPYSVYAMSPTGDVGVDRPSLISADKLCFGSLDGPINTEIFKAVLKLAQEAEVKVLLRPVQYPDLPCNDHVVGFAEKVLAVGSKAGFQSISSVSNARTAASLYYDTTYHLTENGAREKADQLAPVLADFLERAEKG